MNDKRNETPHPRRRGRWLDPQVPFSGWHGVSMEDLGEQRRLDCEMCKSQPVRYVHHMEHPHYPEALRVGFVCAEHMEEDPRAAKRRDADFRNLWEKRKRWPGRASWVLSPDGGKTLRDDGYRTTVERRGELWQVTVSQEGRTKAWQRSGFETVNAAKLAGFDHIVQIKLGRLPWPPDMA